MHASPKALLILNVPPPFGGGEIRAKQLSNYFSGKPEFIIVENTNKKKNKTNQGKVLLSNVFINLGYIWRNILSLLRNRPRVVYMSIPKNLLPLLKIIPVIIMTKMIGGKVLGELAGRNFYFLEKKGFQSTIGLIILKQFNSIRVLGNSVKDTLGTYGLQKTIVIDNGVLIKNQNIKKEKSLGKKTIVLGFIGALHFKKGVFLLMEIAKLLKEDNFDYKLKIAGEWENEKDKQKVLEYIATNDLNQNIDFLGLIHDEQKWNFYETVDVFLLPSYNEGQPLVLIEAMAFGIPIVCSAVGAIPDTITTNHNGFIVKDFLAKEYVLNIKTLVQDKKLYGQISLNNQNTYEERFMIEDYLGNIHQWIISYYTIHETLTTN